MSTEVELRSFILLNTHVHSVYEFFRTAEWNCSVRDIIYFKNMRYTDGKFQKKVRLSTSCRSFLPGVRTFCNTSLEFRGHTSLGKCVIASPGRKLSFSLSDTRESVKKTCFENIRHPNIQAKVYVTCNTENRILTVAVLEVEHRDSADVEFLFRHDVGQHYRLLVEHFWLRYIGQIVVAPKTKPPSANLALVRPGLTKPFHVTPANCHSLLREYDTFLVKLDGIPGYMFFKNNSVTLKLADGKFYHVKGENTFLDYQWSDDVVLRIEYMSADERTTLKPSEIVITDVLLGAYAEPVYELPYQYRLSYLRKLHETIVPAFPVNWSRSPDEPAHPADLANSDGILLVRSLAPEHCYKLKWTYTVDLRCTCPIGREDITRFKTQEDTFYSMSPNAELVPELGQIYECNIDQDGLVSPLKIRGDKSIPDDDETVQLCRNYLNPHCTIPQLWPSGQVGQKNLCVLPK